LAESVTSPETVILVQRASARGREPAPEMAGLAYFEGRWTCEGTMQPSPGAPAGKMTSTAMIHNDLGGFWQSGKIKGTTAGVPPFEGMFHTTYDPAAKQYVMQCVDNMGVWSRSASKGGSDKIVYEGEMQMGSQKMAGRDTFTKGAGGSGVPARGPGGRCDLAQVPELGLEERPGALELRHVSAAQRRDGLERTLRQLGLLHDLELAQDLLQLLDDRLERPDVGGAQRGQQDVDAGGGGHGACSSKIETC
jgi:hypothetical protein